MEILKVIYEKEPFVLMKVRDHQSMFPEGPVEWIRYNKDSDSYEIVEFSDISLDKNLEICCKDSKRRTKIHRYGAHQSGPNDSNNFEGKPESTVRPEQTQPRIEAIEASQVMHTNITAKPPDEQSAITTHDGEEDWGYCAGR